MKHEVVAIEEPLKHILLASRSQAITGSELRPRAPKDHHYAQRIIVITQYLSNVVWNRIHAAFIQPRRISHNLHMR